jgi:hypothetical protein
LTPTNLQIFRWATVFYAHKHLSSAFLVFTTRLLVHHQSFALRFGPASADNATIDWATPISASLGSTILDVLPAEDDIGGAVVSGTFEGKVTFSMSGEPNDVTYDGTNISL